MQDQYCLESTGKPETLELAPPQILVTLDILVRQFFPHLLADKNVRAPAVAGWPLCALRVSAVPSRTPRLHGYG
jgi:hypothetical protein